MSSHLMAGARLGSYEVLSLIGAGGMGEVYRAHDPKLGRDVALKVLPAEFAGDPERLARFRREARMLASLNHPNIAAIHDFEESGGVPYLVLELVEGETLGAPLPIDVALDYAAQVADALTSAHEKGVVHRDLKPANVKVTPAGRVKVLDFGLAKVVWGDGELQHATQWVTRGTDEGAPVLGTPPYISPEQVNGGEADARSDVWAFGCLLYEVLSGKRAFQGRTVQATIAAILHGEPDWEALPAKTPRRVRALLRTCLLKDPARRLPDMRSAADGLRRVRDRASRRSLAAAVLSAVVVGGAVVALANRPLPGRDEWVQLTRLPDAVGQPSLSSDGRMLAFVRGPSTFASSGQIYIKTLPDGEAIQLTNDDEVKMDPVFSPDGSRVAYTVTRDGRWDTWVTPVVRGEPRPWLENASGLRWFGEDQIMFSEIKDGDIHMGLVAGRENRADARDVYVPAAARSMAHRSYASPDNAWVLVVEMDRGIWQPCQLISVDGESPSRSVGPPGAACTSAAWAPDGRWMYLNANAGGAFHIWRQRFPDGEPEQITSGPTEEEGIAMDPDGRSLVTAVALRQSAVYVRDGRGERQISLEGYAFDPRFSPDGRSLVFRVLTGALPTEAAELWIADLPSGRIEPLLPGIRVGGSGSSLYDVSWDGRRLVTSATDVDGNRSIWLVALDRQTPPTPIPNAMGDNPVFSPDGDVLFRAYEGELAFAYRVRTDGTGLERALEDPIAGLRGFSPDGRWLLARVDPAGEAARIVAVSLRGEPDVRITSATSDARVGTAVKWSADGSAMFISVPTISNTTGMTYVLPILDSLGLPLIPEGGFSTESELATWPGVRVLDAFDVAPGPSPDVYALARESVQRNIYRVPLR